MAQPRTSLVAFKRDIIRTRRVMRRLPDTVAAEVVKVLEENGNTIQSVGRSQAPVKTGRLRNALTYRVLPRSLRAEFGLIGRRINRELFYGWILEVGRKGGPSKRWAQRRLKGGGYGKKYKVNVRAISPARYDFTAGRFKTYVRQLLRQPLARVFERALRAASGGI